MVSYTPNYMDDQDLKSYLDREITYNASEGLLWWNFSGPRRQIEKPIGTMHSSGYLLCSVGLNRKVYSLRVHRVCWLLKTGEWPSMKVDHENNMRHDNRWDNLRLATDVENSRNSIKPVTNKSGYKGVSWSSYHNKWVARIGIGNKTHKFLGYFDCPKEAAYCYDKAVGIYHKDFGRSNFEGLQSNGS